MMRFPEHGENAQDPEKQWLAALTKIQLLLLGDESLGVRSLMKEKYPELSVKIMYHKDAPNPGVVGAEYVREIILGIKPKDKSRGGFTLTITDPTDDYIDNRLDDAIRRAHEDWKHSG